MRNAAGRISAYVEYSYFRKDVNVKTVVLLAKVPRFMGGDHERPCHFLKFRISPTYDFAKIPCILLAIFRSCFD